MNYDFTKRCQFCDTEKTVGLYIPAGYMCRKCKKALNKIRKNKIGFNWLPK